MFYVYSFSFISVKRLSVCPLDFFLLAGVGTCFLFAFLHQRSLRKNLDLPLLHKHHHHGFLQISFLAITFRSCFSWFDSLLVLTNVHRTYRQQFAKTTSYLLILLKMFNTRWCFYLHHCISADIDATFKLLPCSFNLDWKFFPSFTTSFF